MRDLQDWHKKVELDARAAQRALQEMQRTAGIIAAGAPAVRTESDAASTLDSAVVLAPGHYGDNHRSGLTRIAGPSSDRVRLARRSRKVESREELISRLLDPTLTLEETARVLEVCPTTVRRYTNKGILQHERSKGNQRRFKLSAVLAFLESQRITAAQKDEE